MLVGAPFHLNEVAEAGIVYLYYRSGEVKFADCFAFMLKPIKRCNLLLFSILCAKMRSRVIGMKSHGQVCLARVSRFFKQPCSKKRNEVALACLPFDAIDAS